MLSEFMYRTGGVYMCVCVYALMRGSCVFTGVVVRQKDQDKGLLSRQRRKATGAVCA